MPTNAQSVTKKEEKKMRIDKFLAHTTGNTRTEVKKLLKQKLVAVDGTVVTSAGLHVDTAQNTVTLAGEELFYQQYVYLMMNKPAGYLSATKDGQEQTVIDLLDDYYLRFDLSIAGRLDKDTEGLLLLTNDGQFLHDVISPRKQVYKKYYCRINGNFDETSQAILESGVTIKDGKDNDYMTAPARVKIVNDQEVEIEICEGKFHQVKRMFKAVGCEVVYLKRLAIGGLVLDEYLELGEYRELESWELDAITKNTES